jgi:putative ABC transport system permease protein
MFRNYLKTALRNLLRNPLYTLINICGLTIGITCSLLILIYIKHEFSYDRFHQKKDQLQRLVFEFATPEGRTLSPQMTAPVGPAMVEAFPEVVRSTRFSNREDGYFTYQEKAYREEGLLYADSSLFRMFSFELLAGDPNTALAAPYSVVLGEETALRIFGENDPLGETIRWNNKDDLVITGVVKAPPANSHLQFSSLISFSSRYRDRRMHMDWNGGMQYHHYLELLPGTDEDVLAAKFPDFMHENINYIYEKSGASINAFLQPIEKIHLRSGCTGEIGPTGSMGNIYIYAAIAIFVLFIACINFMNLTTAMATKRAKEVGMRKVFGAAKTNLVRQFLGESMVMSLIGLVIALVLIEILLPVFGKMVSRQLVLYQWSNLDLLLGIPILVLLVGLLAGSYPAFYLSGFKPVSVLKGLFKGQKGYAGVRNSLVLVQFAISIVLIICTLVIFAQLGFIRSKDLGFNKDNIMVLVFTSDSFKQQYQRLKDALSRIPDVISSSATSEIPGGGFTANGYRPEGFDNFIMFNKVAVDYDFITTLGLQVTSGRSFSEDFSTDREAYLVNEALARQLAWEDPVGKTISRGGDHMVIGMVRDFHFAPVHEEIGSLIFDMNPYTGGYEYLLVRFRTDNLPGLITDIRKAWEGIDPNEPFEYQFMDDVFGQVYREEQRMGSILLYFAIMAIVIACMGLFGLALFNTEQRTREIGIRKVFGSSVSGVILLLSGRFSRWVLLANLLAWPVAYLIVREYMKMYAYKINLPVWIFFLSAAGVYLLALLTISLQSYKAGITNPGDALRYE